MPLRASLINMGFTCLRYALVNMIVLATVIPTCAAPSLVHTL